MDIVKRLFSRVSFGSPWWVMPGGFGKAGGCPKKRDGGARAARVSTVYATGDDLIYVARCTNQIMIHGEYSAYDASMYIAFADPDLVARLLDFLLLERTPGIDQSIKDGAWDAAQAKLKERIEFLNREYAEPAEEESDDRDA